jgi:ABC-2 type transport system permease protein
MSAATMLWWRELVRFARQPSRILSAVASPLVFWLLIGTGLSASFRLPGSDADVSYLEYFFPGTVALLVLFASIFSTISVIEDRHEGFLQGVLVAPVTPSTVVLGKVLGGATLAWLQGSLFLLLAPAAGIPLGAASLAAASGTLALLSLALTAVGFGFAWKVDSTQGFHGVMNLLLVPMWLLSGAFFPLTGAPAWLEWVMRVNPMTYGVASLRRTLYPRGMEVAAELPPLGPSLVVLGGFCLLALLLDRWVVARSEGG